MVNAPVRETRACDDHIFTVGHDPRLLKFESKDAKHCSFSTQTTRAAPMNFDVCRNGTTSRLNALHTRRTTASLLVNAACKEMALVACEPPVLAKTHGEGVRLRKGRVSMMWYLHMLCPTRTRTVVWSLSICAG